MTIHLLGMAHRSKWRADASWQRGVQADSTAAAKPYLLYKVAHSPSQLKAGPLLLDKAAPYCHGFRVMMWCPPSAAPLLRTA